MQLGRYPEGSHVLPAVFAIQEEREGRLVSKGNRNFTSHYSGLYFNLRLTLIPSPISPWAVITPILPRLFTDIWVAYKLPASASWMPNYYDIWGDVAWLASGWEARSKGKMIYRLQFGASQLLGRLAHLLVIVAFILEDKAKLCPCFNAMVTARR